MSQSRYNAEIMAVNLQEGEDIWTNKCSTAFTENLADIEKNPIIHLKSNHPY